MVSTLSVKSKKLPPPSVRAVLAQRVQQPTAEHLISLDKVGKVFKGDRGLKEVSFCVQPGEFAFIVGPTGHGKTTLLRLILGKVKPDQGDITLGGINIRNLDRQAYRRKLGFVSQTLDAVPRLTVEENIAYPLQTLRQDPEFISRRVDELLHVFSLDHARDRLCDEQQLSGGERQRMAIARAIVHGPDLLLCDEPTGNLDEGTTYGVLRTLNRVSMLGTTVLAVTHDPSIVNLMKKRVIVIRDGEVSSDKVGGYRLS